MKDVKHTPLILRKNDLSFVSFEAYRAWCNMSQIDGALTGDAARMQFCSIFASGNAYLQKLNFRKYVFYRQ